MIQYIKWIIECMQFLQFCALNKDGHGQLHIQKRTTVIECMQASYKIECPLKGINNSKQALNSEIKIGQNIDVDWIWGMTGTRKDRPTGDEPGLNG